MKVFSLSTEYAVAPGGIHMTIAWGRYAIGLQLRSCFGAVYLIGWKVGVHWGRFGRISNENWDGR